MHVFLNKIKQNDVILGYLDRSITYVTLELNLFSILLKDLYLWIPKIEAVILLILEAVIFVLSEVAGRGSYSQFFFVFMIYW